jgi:hypothetical protein
MVVHLCRSIKQRQNIGRRVRAFELGGVMRSWVLIVVASSGFQRYVSLWEKFKSQICRI